MCCFVGSSDDAWSRVAALKIKGNKSGFVIDGAIPYRRTVHHAVMRH